MLWSRHYLQVQNSSVFKDWTFSLLSAEIASQALLNASEYTMEHFEDNATDISAMLICAVALFRDEWQRYGIEPSDIHSLLPQGN
jgi:hypothetical protein